MTYELQFRGQMGELANQWQPQHVFCGGVVGGDLAYVLNYMTASVRGPAGPVESRIVETRNLTPWWAFWRAPRLVKRVVLRRDLEGVMHAY